MILYYTTLNSTMLKVCCLFGALHEDVERLALLALRQDLLRDECCFVQCYCFVCCVVLLFVCFITCLMFV